MGYNHSPEGLNNRVTISSKDHCFSPEVALLFSLLSQPHRWLLMTTSHVSNSQSFENSSNAADEYCGTLSDTTISGIP